MTFLFWYIFSGLFIFIIISSNEFNRNILKTQMELSQTNYVIFAIVWIIFYPIIIINFLK